MSNNCYQWVANGAGVVFQPGCTREKCAKWLTKREMCVETDIALSLGSIRYVLNQQLKGTSVGTPINKEDGS